MFTLIILTLWIVSGIYKWSRCNCSNGDTERTLVDDEKSVIAWLSSDNAILPKLRIARFKVEEPYKYPFLSIQYYSDEYYLNLSSIDNLVFVADNKDTLLSGSLRNINTVPNELKVFNSSRIQIATYRPDTIYLNNIKDKPEISIFKQLVLFGPSFQDCMDKCN